MRNLFLYRQNVTIKFIRTILLPQSENIVENHEKCTIYFKEILYVFLFLFPMFVQRIKWITKNSIKIL